MSDELASFRAELRAAGQPWSRWGIWTAGLGIVGLAATQFIGQAAPIAALFFTFLVGSTVLIAIGWVMLIVAMLRRRRWSKAHDLSMPGLSDRGAS